MKTSEKVTISRRILICPLADKNERGRIAYCFMRACIRTVRWLSMKDKVPSGRREFKPIEIPPATFEVGSSLRKLGEEVTRTDRTTETHLVPLSRLPICFVINWEISTFVLEKSSIPIPTMCLSLSRSTIVVPSISTVLEIFLRAILI